MDDRELLELAAKAAGEDVEWHDIGSYFYRKSCNWPAEKGFFNPLHDDGEALRLAVAIGLFTTQQGLSEFQAFYSDEIARDNKPTAATRRAIVIIAAEIGRAM